MIVTEQIRASLRWAAAGLALIMLLAAAPSVEAGSVKKKSKKTVVVQEEVGPTTTKVRVERKVKTRVPPRRTPWIAQPLIQWEELYTLMPNGE